MCIVFITPTLDRITDVVKGEARGNIFNKLLKVRSLYLSVKT